MPKRYDLEFKLEAVRMVAGHPGGLQKGLRISIKMLPRPSLSGLPVKRQIRLPCISPRLQMVLLEYFLWMLLFDQAIMVVAGKRYFELRSCLFILGNHVFDAWDRMDLVFVIGMKVL